jgi:hypothetical protein
MARRPARCYRYCKNKVRFTPLFQVISLWDGLNTISPLPLLQCHPSAS